MASIPRSLLSISCVALSAATLGAVDFAPPMDIAAGSVSGLSAMDAGDIDGDGRIDVLCVEGGKHAGGRQTFAWFAAPADPQGSWVRHDIQHGANLRLFLGAAKLADLDGDGDLDIVVSSDNHSGASMQADVLVFRNPGAGVGTWSHATANVSTMADHHINDMEIGDLDGDGRLDIVVRSLEPNQIRIFFQDSPISWTGRSIATGIAQSEGLGLGDIDGDGRPDITFTGHWLATPTVARTGTFVRRPIDDGYAAVNQNTKEFVADLDGDGDNDVVIGPAEAYRGGDDHRLAWYENPGSGWSGNWTVHLLQSGVNDMHTVEGGDVDGDGDIDVVVGRPWNGKQVLLYVNAGGGAFAAAQVVDSGKGLYSGVLADLGGDGDLDIIGQDVYAGSGKPWIYENLSSGVPSANQPPTITAIGAAAGTVTGIATSLTVSASDPDGDALSCVWTVDAAPSGGQALLGAGREPTVAFDKAGSWRFRATVSDGRGGSDTATVTVDVQQTPSVLVLQP